jgi:DNA processing protein
MRKYPEELFYRGNIELLKRKKISIVGTRKPSKYSREMTHILAAKLAQANISVVSGGAMGIDAVAHNGAGVANTISVLPCGLNHKYPAINKNLLLGIEKEGLLLSQFEDDFKARGWSFVVRNEVVVALGEVLVVSEAELGSGSMKSIEYALKMGKEIYFFPQRLGESGATHTLLSQGKAKLIYDIGEFVSKFTDLVTPPEICDPFLEYCKTTPSYEALLLKFPSRVFEAELKGEIEVRNAKVYLL